MLDSLRKASSGWVAQLLIALLVVSFAVWGISGFFTGFNAEVVATVGNTDVTVRQFAREYEARLRQAGQQFGQQITPELAQMLQLPQQVLQQLVFRAALTSEAGRMRMGISDQRVVDQIHADPRFHDASGAYSPALLDQFASQLGMSRDEYFEERRTANILQQITDGLAGETQVPDAFMRALAEYRGEERNLSWLVLAPGIIVDLTDPSETDLQAYFDANKGDWRAPEYRAVTLMSLSPADLADTGAVTDADAQALYDRVSATRFSTPERRRIQQIVFDSEADGQQAAAAVSGGKTFDELLTDRGQTPEAVDIGLLAREDIIDPKVAEAAFGLDAGGVSPLIAGQFGPIMIRVTEIQPAAVTPFAEVKDQLKEELAQSRAAEEISDQIDVIEDARAGGATLAEVAGNYGLTLRTIPAIDASGRDADGNAIADLPGGQSLVTEIFQSDVGLDNNPIPVDKGYVWFDVTAVAAERDRELAEVREKVITAWKAAEVQKRLAARADDIRKQLENGGDIAAIAAGAGLTVETATGVKRVGDPPAGLDQAAIQAAFGGPKGYAAVTDGADGAKLVIVATDVTVPPYFAGAPDLVEPQKQFSQDMANDLLTTYVYQLQQRLGVSINQAAFNTAIGVTESGGRL